MGIEPTQSAWKAEVLPLNYTRIVFRCIRHPLADISLHAANARQAEDTYPFSASLNSGGNTAFGGGGRITPRLRRSALRAAALRATYLALCACVEPPVRFASSPARNWRKILLCWWRGEDSNLRRLSRQIYSLIPLTAREPLQKRGGILWEAAMTVNCTLAAAVRTTRKNTATTVVGSRRLRRQRPNSPPTASVCGGLNNDKPLRTLEKS